MKCKLNDVIFPSGCEARAINLGNKNMKIGIFTGGTSVRSKNIFTDISRYPTGKHETVLRKSLVRRLYQVPDDTIARRDSLDCLKLNEFADKKFRCSKNERKFFVSI